MIPSLLLGRSPAAREIAFRAGEAEAPEEVVHATCGVVAGGKLYLASVDHDYANSPAGDAPLSRGEPVMHLVVADLADVAGMDLARFEVLGRGDDPGATAETDG